MLATVPWHWWCSAWNYRDIMLIVYHITYQNGINGYHLTAALVSDNVDNNFFYACSDTKTMVPTIMET